MAEPPKTTPQKPQQPNPTPHNPNQTHEQQEAERKRREEEQKQAREAKTAQATSTYNAAKGTTSLEDPRGDRFLTHDEIKSLAGDIQPGELGFLKLDEEGKPTGTVITDVRDVYDETPKATVIANRIPVADEIVTPSGAPISKFMNPDTTLWDAGMLARNPPPKEDSDLKHRGPVGGGVINQPVTA
jgi:hypothetical protein